MALSFENLDETTRRFMIAEFERDQADGTMYIGRFLNDHGVSLWPSLLSEACKRGSDETLAAELRRNLAFKSHYEKKKASGGFSQAAVPYTAAEMLAEGQFNQLYIRALCARAIEEGLRIQVYRAKQVAQQRQTSLALLDQLIDPAYTLGNLRENKGVDPPTDIPLPNSGLSVRLVKI